MKNPIKSIRWRIQLWYGLVLLLVVLCFCLTAHQLVRDNQKRRLDKDLILAERALYHALLEANPPPPPPSEARNSTGTSPERPPPSPFHLVELTRNGSLRPPLPSFTFFNSQDPGYYYYAVGGPDERFRIQSANTPGRPTLPGPAGKEPLEDFHNTSAGTRERLLSFPNGLRTLVGRDLTLEREDMRRLAWSLAGIGSATWLIGMLGGWWIAGRAIRPIADISSTAGRIAGGNLDERIQTVGTDSELDELSRVLNHTFDRLGSTLRQQKQFTADASHELRTPVTILLSETQRILRRERSPAEYREVLQTCQDTANRMRHLVEDLLLLARQESLDPARPLKPCDLAEVLQETLNHLAPLAAANETRLEASLQSSPCLGDAPSLSILASNLITNAIQHQPRGGIVRIACSCQAQEVLFTVCDEGPGIPAPDLPHIFERFYRVDKARTHGSGHSGLGLAIARNIALNHKGSLKAANLSPHGAQFTLRLPLLRTPPS